MRDKQGEYTIVFLLAVLISIIGYTKYVESSISYISDYDKRVFEEIFYDSSLITSLFEEDHMILNIRLLRIKLFKVLYDITRVRYQLALSKLAQEIAGPVYLDLLEAAKQGSSNPAVEEFRKRKKEIDSEYRGLLLIDRRKYEEAVRVARVFGLAENVEALEPLEIPGKAEEN